MSRSALDDRVLKPFKPYSSSITLQHILYIVIEKAYPAHVHLSIRQNHSLVDGTTVSSAAVRRAQQRKSGPKIVESHSGDGHSERGAMCDGGNAGWHGPIGEFVIPDRRVISRDLKPTSIGGEPQFLEPTWRWGARIAKYARGVQFCVHCCTPCLCNPSRENGGG
jgi:hypothetical protein